MTRLHLENFTVGQTFRSGQLTVTEAEITRFGQEFDPQPFHLDPDAAKSTFFCGLAASGWHTAALTMRLLVDSGFTPAGGIVGAGFEELSWPRPVRPGDTLQVSSEMLELRPSRSRPNHGLLKVHGTTLNQDDKPVQISIGNLIALAQLQTAS